MEEIGNWFADPGHTSRMAKVLGYTGCRELWLQAELAMWLERRGQLEPDGDWDTNLCVAAYGRCDLAVRRGGGGLELALEIKVLGGSYQAKVLTGSAGTLAALRTRNWTVTSRDLEQARGFSLLADCKRLRGLTEARKKILLLIVDNRRGADTPLGEALVKLKLPSREAQSFPIAEAIHARAWRL